MDEILTTLRDAAYTTYDILVMPGDWLTSHLLLYTPALAAGPGVSGDNSVGALPLFLSLCAWVIVALLVWKLLHLCQRLARVIGAMIRTISFRLSLALANVKTMLVCKLGRLIGWRQSGSAHAATEVELDHLDLAILRCANARGPAFALSAPELAAQFRLRPAQVQRSLNKLLDPAPGSADAFKNYRLNDTGAHFVAMWQRQEAGA